MITLKTIAQKVDLTIEQVQELAEDVDIEVDFHAGGFLYIADKSTGEMFLEHLLECKMM